MRQVSNELSTAITTSKGQVVLEVPDLAPGATTPLMTPIPAASASPVVLRGTPALTPFTDAPSTPGGFRRLTPSGTATPAGTPTSLLPTPATVQDWEKSLRLWCSQLRGLTGMQPPKPSIVNAHVAAKLHVLHADDGDAPKLRMPEGSKSPRRRRRKAASAPPAPPPTATDGGDVLPPHTVVEAAGYVGGGEALLVGKVVGGSAAAAATPHGAPKVGQCALAHVWFWGQKRKRLASALAQLCSPGALTFFGTVEGEAAEGGVLSDLRALEATLQADKQEAADLATHLDPLRPPLLKLASTPAQSFPTWALQFRTIFQSLLVVTTRSPHFTPHKVMRGFLHALVDDVMVAAAQYVQFESLVGLAGGGNPLLLQGGGDSVHLQLVECGQRLGDTQWVCAQLSDMYAEFAAQSVSAAPDRQWAPLGSPGLPLARLEAFVERCSQVRSVVTLVLQFRTLHLVRVAGEKARMLQALVAHVHEDFVAAVGALQRAAAGQVVLWVGGGPTGDGDAFSAWYEALLPQVATWEDRVANILELGFRLWLGVTPLPLGMSGGTPGGMGSPAPDSPMRQPWSSGVATDREWERVVATAARSLGLDGDDGTPDGDAEGGGGGDSGSEARPHTPDGPPPPGTAAAVAAEASRHVAQAPTGSPPTQGRSPAASPLSMVRSLERGPSTPPRGLFTAPSLVDTGPISSTEDPRPPAGAVLQSAVLLFAALAPVLERPALHPRVLKQYSHVINVAMGEVQTVMLLFLRHHAAPPRFPHFPEYAGRVAWARALQRRMDEAVTPVVEHCPAPLGDGSSSVAAVLQGRQGRLSHLLRAYCRQVVRAWAVAAHFAPGPGAGGDAASDAASTDSRDQATIAMENLCKPLLRRCDVVSAVADTVRTDLETVFNFFDRDGSASIDLGEFRSIMARLGVPLPDKELTALFQRLDADANGSIAINEFAAWWTSDFHSLRRTFRSVDKDGSGFIDMFEFATLLRTWGVSFGRHQFQTAMKQLARGIEARRRNEVGGDARPASPAEADASAYPRWVRPVIQLVSRKRWLGAGGAPGSGAATTPNPPLPTATPAPTGETAAGGGGAPLLINFEGFALWWKSFSRRSGKRLLAVNFDASLTTHLREIRYFLMLGEDLPESAVLLYEMQGSLRSDLAQVESIVSLYNGMHVTLNDEEWPLVENAMQALDEVLSRGLTQLHWRSKGVKDYLTSTHNLVASLSHRLLLLKEKSQTIADILASWGDTPVVAVYRPRAPGEGIPGDADAGGAGGEDAPPPVPAAATGAGGLAHAPAARKQAPLAAAGVDLGAMGLHDVDDAGGEFVMQRVGAPISTRLQRPGGQAATTTVVPADMNVPDFDAEGARDARLAQQRRGRIRAQLRQADAPGSMSPRVGREVARELRRGLSLRSTRNSLLEGLRAVGPTAPSVGLSPGGEDAVAHLQRLNDAHQVRTVVDEPLGSWSPPPGGQTMALVSPVRASVAATTMGGRATVGADAMPMPPTVSLPGCGQFVAAARDLIALDADRVLKLVADIGELSGLTSGTRSTPAGGLADFDADMAGELDVLFGVSSSAGMNVSATSDATAPAMDARGMEARGGVVWDVQSRRVAWRGFLRHVNDSVREALWEMVGGGLAALLEVLWPGFETWLTADHLDHDLNATLHPAAPATPPTAPTPTPPAALPAIALVDPSPSPRRGSRPSFASSPLSRRPPTWRSDGDAFPLESPSPKSAATRRPPLFHDHGAVLEAEAAAAATAARAKEMGRVFALYPGVPVEGLTPAVNVKLDLEGPQAPPKFTPDLDLPFKPSMWRQLHDEFALLLPSAAPAPPPEVRPLVARRPPALEALIAGVSGEARDPISRHSSLSVFSTQSNRSSSSEEEDDGDGLGALDDVDFEDGGGDDSSTAPSGMSVGDGDSLSAARLFQQLAGLLGDLFGVTACAPNLLATRADLSHMRNLVEDAGLMALRRQLVGVVARSAHDAVVYRDSTYTQFAFLWLSSRHVYASTFLSAEAYVEVRTRTPQMIAAGAEAGATDGGARLSEVVTATEAVVRVPQLPAFEEHLDALRAHADALARVPTSVQCGCLRLDTRSLHATLRTELAKWQYVFVSELEAYVTREVDEMTRFLADTQLRLAPFRSPSTLWTPTVLDTVMATLMTAATRYSVWANVSASAVSGAVDLIQRHGAHVDATLLRAPLDAAAQWAAVNRLCADVKKNVAAPVAARSAELQSLSTRFSHRLADHRKHFLADAPFKLTCAPKDAYRQLDVLHDDLLHHQADLAALEKDERLYEVVPSPSDIDHRRALDACATDLAHLKAVWDVVSVVLGQLVVWRDVVWESLPHDEVVEEVGVLLRLLRDLPSPTAAWPVVQSVVARCSSLQATVPLMEELASSSLRPRHWAALSAALPQPNTVYDGYDALVALTVRDVMALRLQGAARVVHDVVRAAGREAAMEAVADGMAARWEAATVDVTPVPSTWVLAGMAQPPPVSTPGAEAPSPTEAPPTTRSSSVAVRTSSSLTHRASKASLRRATAVKPALTSSTRPRLRPFVDGAPDAPTQFVVATGSPANVALLAAASDDLITVRAALTTSAGRYFSQALGDLQAFLACVEKVLTQLDEAQGAWLGVRSLFLGTSAGHRALVAAAPDECHLFEIVDEEMGRLVPYGSVVSSPLSSLGAPASMSVPVSALCTAATAQRVSALSDMLAVCTAALDSVVKVRLAACPRLLLAPRALVMQLFGFRPTSLPAAVADAVAERAPPPPAAPPTSRRLAKGRQSRGALPTHTPNEWRVATIGEGDAGGGRRPRRSLPLVHPWDVAHMAAVAPHAFPGTKGLVFGGAPVAEAMPAALVRERGSPSPDRGSPSRRSPSASSPPPDWADGGEVLSSPRGRASAAAPTPDLHGFPVGFGDVAAVSVEGTGGDALALRTSPDDVLTVGDAAPTPEEWLAGLEHCIQRSVRVHLAAVLPLAFAQLKARDPAARTVAGDALDTAWMADAPSQVVLLAAHCVWVADVEAAYGAEHAGAAMLHVLDAQASASRRAVAALRAWATPVNRRRLSALAVALLHQRDVVEALREAPGLASGVPFEWSSRLRASLSSPHWSSLADGDVVPRADALAVTVACGDAHVAYGFEFVGDAGVDGVVLTPPVERCHLAAMQAFSSFSGVGVLGEPGSGKAATLKSLSAAVGHPVASVACSPVVSPTAVAAYVRVAFAGGVWLLLRNPAALPRTSLSVLGAQLTAAAVALRQCGGEAASVHLDGVQVAQHHSGAFAFMMTAGHGLPGPADATALPPTLRSVFRCVALLPPDVAVVCASLLAAAGFSPKRAFGFGRKLVHLADGLRCCMPDGALGLGIATLRAVVAAAGRRLRASLAGAGMSGVSDDRLVDGSADATKVAGWEAAALQAAVCDMLLPQVTPHGFPAFSSQVHAAFPSMPLVTVKAALRPYADPRASPGPSPATPPERLVVRTALGTPPSRLAHARRVGALSVSTPTSAAGGDASDALGWMQDVSPTHVYAAAHSLGLAPRPPFVRRVAHLMDLMRHRRAVLVVGGPGVGKSAVWSTAAGAVAAAGQEAAVDAGVAVTRMFPSALTLDTMYGWGDGAEWQDGIVTAAARAAGRRGASPFSMSWLVMDGEVGEWAEPLHGLAEGGAGGLATAAGERVPAADSLRLVFEATDLSSASPALVARAGILHLDAQDVGWQAVVGQWLNGVASPDMQVCVAELLHRYFTAALKFTGGHGGGDTESTPSAAADVGGVSPLGRVQATLRLLDAVTRCDGVPLDGHTVASAASLWNFAKYLLFALAWGFAGHLNAYGRRQFDAFVRKALPDAPVPPPSDSLFDVVVCPMAVCRALPPGDAPFVRKVPPATFQIQVARGVGASVGFLSEFVPWRVLSNRSVTGLGIRWFAHSHVVGGACATPLPVSVMAPAPTSPVADEESLFRAPSTRSMDGGEKQVEGMRPRVLAPWVGAGAAGPNLSALYMPTTSTVAATYVTSRLMLAATFVPAGVRDTAPALGSQASMASSPGQRCAGPTVGAARTLAALWDGGKRCPVLLTGGAASGKTVLAKAVLAAVGASVGNGLAPSGLAAYTGADGLAASRLGASEDDVAAVADAVAGLSKRVVDAGKQLGVDVAQLVYGEAEAKGVPAPAPAAPPQPPGSIPPWLRKSSKRLSVTVPPLSVDVLASPHRTPSPEVTGEWDGMSPRASVHSGALPSLPSPASPSSVHEPPPAHQAAVGHSSDPHSVYYAAQYLAAGGHLDASTLLARLRKQLHRTAWVPAPAPVADTTRVVDVVPLSPGSDVSFGPAGVSPARPAVRAAATPWQAGAGSASAVLAASGSHGGALNVCVDDVNLAPPSAHHLLRQVIDARSWTADEGGSVSSFHVLGVQLVATCSARGDMAQTLAPGVGRRLLRHFNVVAVDAPPAGELASVFTHVVKPRVKAALGLAIATQSTQWVPDDAASPQAAELPPGGHTGIPTPNRSTLSMIAAAAAEATLRLVSGTLALQGSVASGLPPAADAGAPWCVRHAARHLQGFLAQLTPAVAFHPLATTRLWRHEAERTYCDGLPSPAAVGTFKACMDGVTVDTFLAVTSGTDAARRTFRQSVGSIVPPPGAAAAAAREAASKADGVAFVQVHVSAVEGTPFGGRLASSSAIDGDDGDQEETQVQLPLWDELKEGEVMAAPNLWWPAPVDAAAVGGGYDVTPGLHHGGGLNGSVVVEARRVGARRQVGFAGVSAPGTVPQGGVGDDDAAVDPSVSATPTTILPGQLTGGLLHARIAVDAVRQAALGAAPTMPHTRVGTVALFDSCVLHVLRLLRVLALPGGCPFVVGPACVGKRTLLHLAALLADFHVVDLVDVAFPDGDAILRDMYTAAGLGGRRSLLIVTAGDLRRGPVTRAAHALLTGVLPQDAFSAAQRRTVLGALASKRGTGPPPATPEASDDLSTLPPPPSWVQGDPAGVLEAASWAAFLRAAARRCRVAVTASPQDGSVGEVLEVLPAVGTMAHVDRVYPWSEAAMVAVATRALTAEALAPAVGMADRIRVGLEMTAVNDVELKRLMARISRRRQGGARRQRRQRVSSRAGGGGSPTHPEAAPSVSAAKEATRRRRRASLFRLLPSVRGVFDNMGDGDGSSTGGDTDSDSVLSEVSGEGGVDGAGFGVTVLHGGDWSPSPTSARRDSFRYSPTSTTRRRSSGLRGVEPDTTTDHHNVDELRQVCASFLTMVHRSSRMGLAAALAAGGLGAGGDAASPTNALPSTLADMAGLGARASASGEPGGDVLDERPTCDVPLTARHFLGLLEGFVATLRRRAVTVGTTADKYLQARRFLQRAVTTVAEMHDALKELRRVLADLAGAETRKAKEMTLCSKALADASGRLGQCEETHRLFQERIVAVEEEIKGEVAKATARLDPAVAGVEALDNRTLHEARATSSPGAPLMIAMGAVLTLLSGVMPGVCWSPGGEGAPEDGPPPMTRVDVEVAAGVPRGRRRPEASSRGAAPPGGATRRPKPPPAPTIPVPSWSDVRNKVLAKPDVLMQLLRSFGDLIHTGAIPAANFEAVRPYLALRLFSAAPPAGSRNRLLAALLAWTTATTAYYRAHDFVGRRQAHADALASDCSRAEVELRLATAEVETCRRRLGDLTTAYANATRAQQEATSQLEAVEHRLKLGVRIVVALQTEGVRWADHLNHLQAQAATVLGDSLVAAAFLSCGGSLTPTQRKDVLWRLWVPFLRGWEAPLAAGTGADPLRTLATPQQRLLWQSRGVSQDSDEQEGAALLLTCPDVPLVVDPHHAATRFLLRQAAATARRLVVIPGRVACAGVQPRKEGVQWVGEPAAPASPVRGVHGRRPPRNPHHGAHHALGGLAPVVELHRPSSVGSLTMPPSPTNGDDTPSSEPSSPTGRARKKSDLHVAASQAAAALESLPVAPTPAAAWAARLLAIRTAEAACGAGLLPWATKQRIKAGVAEALHPLAAGSVSASAPHAASADDALDTSAWLGRLRQAVGDGSWVVVDDVADVGGLDGELLRLLRLGLGRLLPDAYVDEAVGDAAFGLLGQAAPPSRLTATRMAIGGVTVAVHPNFRLFITTRRTPPRVPDALAGVLNVVSFAPTRQQLMDGVLDALSAEMQPEATAGLAASRASALQQGLELSRLEASLLEKLVEEQPGAAPAAAPSAATLRRASWVLGPSGPVPFSRPAPSSPGDVSSIPGLSPAVGEVLAAPPPWLADDALVVRLEHIVALFRATASRDFSLHMNQETVAHVHRALRPPALRAVELYYIRLHLGLAPSPFFSSVRQVAAAVRPSALQTSGHDVTLSSPLVAELSTALLWRLFASTVASLPGHDRTLVAPALALRVLRLNGRLSVPEARFVLFGGGGTAQHGDDAPQSPTSDAMLSPAVERVRSPTSPFDWLPQCAWNAVVALGTVPSCADLGSDMVSSGERQWRQWVASHAPERLPMPQGWQSRPLLQRLCVFRALRPDRMSVVLTQLVREVLGPAFTTSSALPCDAAALVRPPLGCSPLDVHAVHLVAVGAQDAVGHVERARLQAIVGGEAGDHVPALVCVEVGRGAVDRLAAAMVAGDWVLVTDPDAPGLEVLLAAVAAAACREDEDDGEAYGAVVVEVEEEGEGEGEDGREGKGVEEMEMPPPARMDRTLSFMVNMMSPDSPAAPPMITFAQAPRRKSVSSVGDVARQAMADAVAAHATTEGPPLEPLDATRAALCEGVDRRLRLPKPHPSFRLVVVSHEADTSEDARRAACGTMGGAPVAEPRVAPLVLQHCRRIFMRHGDCQTLKERVLEALRVAESWDGARQHLQPAAWAAAFQPLFLAEPGPGPPAVHPAVWQRLVFMLCWFHATLESRSPALLPRFGLTRAPLVTASHLVEGLAVLRAAVAHAPPAASLQAAAEVWMPAAVQQLLLIVYSAALATEADLDVASTHLGETLRPELLRTTDSADGVPDLDVTNEAKLGEEGEEEMKEEEVVPPPAALVDDLRQLVIGEPEPSTPQAKVEDEGKGDGGDEGEGGDAATTTSGEGGGEEEAPGVPPHLTRMFYPFTIVAPHTPNDLAGLSLPPAPLPDDIADRASSPQRRRSSPLPTTRPPRKSSVDTAGVGSGDPDVNVGAALMAEAVEDGVAAAADEDLDLGVSTPFSHFPSPFTTLVLRLPDDDSVTLLGCHPAAGYPRLLSQAASLVSGAVALAGRHVCGGGWGQSTSTPAVLAPPEVPATGNSPDAAALFGVMPLLHRGLALLSDLRQSLPPPVTLRAVDFGLAFSSRAGTTQFQQGYVTGRQYLPSYMPSASSASMVPPGVPGSVAASASPDGSQAVPSEVWQRMRRGMERLVRRLSMAKRFAPHLAQLKGHGITRSRRGSVSLTPPATPKSRRSSPIPGVSSPLARKPSAGGGWAAAIRRAPSTPTNFRPATQPPAAAATDTRPSFAPEPFTPADPNTVFRDVFLLEAQALNARLATLRSAVQQLSASVAACEATLLAALPRGADVNLTGTTPAVAAAATVLRSPEVVAALHAVRLLLRGFVPPAWIAGDRVAPDTCRTLTTQLDEDPLAGGRVRQPCVQVYTLLERLHDAHAQVLLWQSYMDAYREGNADLVLSGHDVSTRGGMLDAGAVLKGAGEGGAAPDVTYPLPPVVWLTGLDNPKRFIVALQHAVALSMGAASDEVHLVARVTSDFDTVEAAEARGATPPPPNLGPPPAGRRHTRQVSTASAPGGSAKPDPRPASTPGSGLKPLDVGGGNSPPPSPFDHIRDGIHASGFRSSGVMWDADRCRLQSLGNTAASGLLPGLTAAELPMLRLTLQRLPRGGTMTSPSASMSYLTQRRRGRARRRLSVAEEDVAVLRAYVDGCREEELFVVELPVDSRVPQKEWTLAGAALELGD